MAVSSPLLFLLLFLQQATSELVYESGYTVTTILDGNKLRIPVNPFSLLPAQDGLLLLDSTNSRFYTLSLPISQESAINRFSGDGVGFSDGVPTAAKFDRPRSFAVDSKGNVYVADKNNHAIRKISSTLGVTTIAGGYSQKPGHFDGPGQNASFSDDFDVAYIPKLCSLLITDHGSRLVRQINLKTEDCAHKSPRFEMGMASVSGIGVLCLLLGLVAGFTVRPFLVSNQIFAPHFVSKTWSRSSTSLRIQTLILFSDIRNAVASSAPLILLRRLVGLTISYLSLMFRVCRVEKKNLRPCHVSLVDSDAANNQSMEKSQIFTYQLKDLTSFDGRPAVSESEKSIKQEQQEDGVSNGRHCKIDDMIQASILAFDSQVILHDPVIESSSLSRRRPTFEEMFT